MEQRMINFEEILARINASENPAEELEAELWAWWEEGYRSCSEDT